MQALAMVIGDGQPVCPKCGGGIQCSGTVTVSFVDVNADCYEEGGEVHLTHDWTDAGSAEFEPTEYHCVGCGVVLMDPGDLTSEG